MHNLLVGGAFLLSVLDPATPVYAEEPPPVVEDVVVDVLASNCYLYVKSLVPELPRTAELLPNTNYPNILGIVILDYDGLKHYAKVTSVLVEGIWIKESNFVKGGYTSRIVSWDYLKDHNAQYWTPSDIRLVNEH
jgi:hypothetical protein